VQWQNVQEGQPQSPEDLERDDVDTPAPNDRSFRRRAWFSCVLVLIAIAVVSVTTAMIRTPKQNGSTTPSLPSNESSAIPPFSPSNQSSASSPPLSYNQSTTTPPSPSFKCFDSSEELQGAVDRFMRKHLIDVKELNNTYGFPIGTWCVSSVTNFSHLFSAERNPAMEGFNEPLSSWDTSNVTDMSYMFLNAASFNQTVSHFNVSKVTTMASMFDGAQMFNQDLQSWNTTCVVDMSFMFSGNPFYYLESFFNQAVSHLYVSQVTNMAHMFDGAQMFNQDLQSWNTTNVVDMSFMFYRATAFNQAVSHLDVSQVKNMSGMFDGAENFNQDLQSWNTTRVVDMSFMFSRDQNRGYNSSFNQAVSHLDVSQVTNMAYMFSGAENFNQDLQSWNMTHVVDMSSMFSYATTFNQNLCAWSSIIRQETDLSNMFDETSCPMKVDPTWNALGFSPLCHDC